MRPTTGAAFLGLMASTAVGDTTDEQLHNLSHFFESATVVAGPTAVDCTLSAGTKTTCFSITVKSTPNDSTPGPWCPSAITDDASAGGIWFFDNKARDVDGAFVENLSTLYDDPEWQMFDPETGKVNVTDTKAACEAAARPDVDPAYNNYCVQCLPEYMADDATMTYVIPLIPQPTVGENRTNFSGSGIAYNGVRLDGPAPVDAILSAHTIAPFDDCGGHVNIHVGYHYHAATDCLSGASVVADHAAQIGIAMDGYGLFGHTLTDGSAPTDLDQCGGHIVDGMAYHYHAGEVGSNAIVACLVAETGCVSEVPDQVCDAAARPPRP